MAWWVLANQANAWPLVIGLIPWGIRLAAGKFPLQRTALDTPMVIFVLTAGVGVWAAYDRAAAWNKFWLIAAAVLLFYALAGQQLRDIWVVIGFFSTCGTLLAILSILSPSTIESEIVAGALVIILPFTISWGVNLWHQRQVRRLPGLLIAGGLMVWAVVMSRERGAWLGLGLLVVLLLLVVWFRAANSNRRKAIITASIAFSCILIGVVFIGLLAAPGTAEHYRNRLNSRLEGITNTTYLAGEFPFIGGGLRSYPGLYSRYVFVIPYLFQKHGHNVLLDVAVEQGWIGLAALLWIYIGSGWRVIRAWANDERYPGQKVLRAAVLCSLILLVIHNLTDDALYSAQGAVCLFIVPGLSWLVSRKDLEPANASGIAPETRKSNRWVVITAGGAVLLLLIAVWRFLAAAFYANLGVVEMARVHLAGWPTERVEGERLLAVIGPAELTFQKSLQYNPNQITALYRLGMIAVQRRDYDHAKSFLTKAYEALPGHYGIRKLLGYSHLWLGDSDKAAILLKPDSETLKELDSYTFWWKTQNRAELSSLAQELAARLRETRK